MGRDIAIDVFNQKRVVPSSLIIKKLGSYPRQNSLATAIREIGKIERTIFTLEWIRDPNLRRRVHTGLNKGKQNMHLQEQFILIDLEK